MAGAGDDASPRPNLDKSPETPMDRTHQRTQTSPVASRAQIKSENILIYYRYILMDILQSSREHSSPE